MNGNKKYDFSGYATRCNVQCADGRIIRKDAFKDQDGTRVPVVWNHDHTDNSNVLGHADLENREDGVYAYITMNEDVQRGRDAKAQVMHGDITSLSIYANHVRQNGPNVVHGVIREVSLVLAGANPGAFIDTRMAHSEDGDEEAVIYSGEEGFEVFHSEETNERENEPENDTSEGEDVEMADKDINDMTVDEAIDHIQNKLTDDEFAFMMGLVTEVAATADENDNEGDNEMKQSAFANDAQQYETNDGILVHSENGDTYISRDDEKKIWDYARRNGGMSLKEAIFAHGITSIDLLFPDYETLDKTPQVINDDTSWVSVVMNGVHKTPFDKVRSLFADITGPEARARGYVKGNQKVEEIISLLKRETGPTTVYKLQKFDRDDLLDADFDIARWIHAEMEGKLKEELARAYLIGDGRPDGDDKINETHIRPIYTDADLFTVKVGVKVSENGDTRQQKAEKIIDEVIRSRKLYKGSGNPKFFINEDWYTEMLLIKDQIGHYMYDKSSLATRLRVSEIVPVPPMEGVTREVNGEDRPLVGIIVNLNDYNVGLKNKGRTTLFDDFDIDFNKQKYLIETRQSGALIKPYSAMTIELDFQ